MWQLAENVFSPVVCAHLQRAHLVLRAKIRPAHDCATTGSTGC